MKLTYKEFQKLNNQAPKRIYGSNSGTLMRYCKYIYSLLRERNLTLPYLHLQLRDAKLLEKYHINPTDGYSYMIEKLEKLEIIKCTCNKWSPDILCKRYAVDVHKLVEIFSECVDKHSWLYPIHHVWVSYIPLSLSPSIPSSSLSFILPYIINENIEKSEMRYPEMITFYDPDYEEMITWLERDTVVTLEDIQVTELYRDNPQFFEQIDKKNPEKMEEMWFTLKSPLTRVERQILSSYYVNKLITENKWFLESKKEIEAINSLDRDFQVRMPMHVKIKGGNAKLGLTPSCRQFNDLCGMASKDRHEWLREKGYDGEFDLHSAIYAVTRLMNTGEFDVDWDIKRAVIEDYDKLNSESKSLVKEIMMRAFFESSLKQAAVRFYNQHPRSVTLESFTQIYNESQEEIGGSTNYRGNIFAIESLLELRVIHRVLDMGFDIQNVYDCFYFKTSQISEEELKEIITEEAYRLLEV